MATATNSAIRFTEEKYATKSEVGKELKIHFVDPIWSSILSYRANYNKYLTLYTIENRQFVFCLCETISDSITNLNSKLNNVVREFQKLLNNNSDYNYLRTTSLASSLQHLARMQDLDVTHEYLTGIIRGDVRSLSSSHAVLNNYLNALKYIESSYINSINDDFLAKLYEILLGTDELTHFYRKLEDKAPENKVLIDRVYTAAPVKLIDGLMNSLYNFINNSTLSPVVRALVAYYYINYIKPFSSYNDEIALLTAKAILAHFDLGAYSVLLPLEKFLSSDLEKISTLCYEVQKTSDITYFINYGIIELTKIANDTLDKIVNHNVVSLKNDFFQADEQPTIKKEEPVIKKEPMKVVEEVKVDVQPMVVIQPAESSEGQIAVSYIPKAIDEKEAYRLEKHLLELDPSLKKGEAKFYARHCTIGKKYTIQNYKKYIGCVYETARTSMDHLAELGYYRKEQVKNKYVYAPIPRQ